MSKGFLNKLTARLKVSPNSKRLDLSKIVLLVLPFALALFLLGRGIGLFKPRAASVNVFFDPSQISINNGETKNISILADSGNNSVGFVHIDVVFDRSKLELAADATTGDSLKRVVLKTTKSQTDNCVTTCRLTLAFGLDPNDIATPANGVFEIARLNFTPSTQESNQQTTLSFDEVPSSFVSMILDKLTFTSDISSVSINPTSPTDSPTPTPGLTVSPTPTPQITPSPTVSVTNTPTPTQAQGNSLITSGVEYFNDPDSYAKIWRPDDKVQLPASDDNLISGDQGWVAVRMKMGFNSSDTNLVPDPIIWDKTASGGGNPLFLYFDFDTRKFSMASLPTVRSAIQTFTAGAPNAEKTIIGAWTPTQVKISVDGSNFTTVARTGVPNTGSFYIGSSVNQGPDPTHRQPNSDYYWVAAGKGTLTDNDVHIFHGLGNNDPSFLGLPGSPSFLWRAESNAYTK